MYKFSWCFFLLWTAQFAPTIANIYLAEKKLGIANWSIEGKKNPAIFYIIVFIVKIMAGREKEWNSAMETVILNKFLICFKLPHTKTFI